MFDFGSMMQAGNQVAGQIIGIYESHKNRQQASDLSEAGIKATRDNMRDFNTHALLDKYSGGLYSSYLKNQAFASPERQGEMAREKQQAMYPELTAYELAGSPSAGVASSVGDTATNVASKNAAAESAQRAQAMQSETALRQSEIQAKTATAVAGINSQTQLATTAMQTGNAAMLGKAKLAQDAPKVAAETSKIWADKSLSESNKQLAVAKTIESQAKSSNISMDTKVKSELVALTRARTVTEQNATSQVGKTIKDAFAMSDKAKSYVEDNFSARLNNVFKLLTKQNNAKAAASFITDVTGYAKQGAQWIREKWDAATAPSDIRIPDPRRGVARSY